MSESDRQVSPRESDIANEVQAVVAEYRRRRAAGEVISDQQIIDAHPELKPHLEKGLQQLLLIGQARQQAEQRGASTEVRLVSADATQPHLPDAANLRIRCPHCQNAIELLLDTPFTDITCQICFSTFSITGGDSQSRSAPPLKTVGHFELIARVGVGGFGTLWQAHDTQLDRTVAVKIPRRGQLDAAQAEQFLREARITAQLKHANIVSVYEVGREGSMIYIVSDFIRGMTLSSWLTECKPTFRETAELFVKIADALDHAHRKGVVHRDMKPSNVMMDEEGEPHITDFGLAKRELGEITMTLDGQVLGTPAFMSPEQARGKGHYADRRSDIYSLGVMLFQQLCGELPFRGNAQMQMQQIIMEDAPSPRKFNPFIPRDLETICLKCLEKHPDSRFSTAKHLSDELRRFLDGVPIRSRPISRTTRIVRWCQRKPSAAVAIGLVALIAVVSPIVAIRERTMRIQLAESNRKVANSNKALAAELSFLEPEREKLFGAWQQKWEGLREQEAIRENLLGQARVHFQQKLDQVPIDQGDLLRRARLQAGLAMVTNLGDNRAESIKEFQATLPLLEQLVTEHPETLNYRAALANACYELGRLQREQGEVAEAQENIERAQKMRSELIEQHPHTVEHFKALLDSYVELARVQSAAQDPEAAMDTLTEADGLMNRWNQQWPNDPLEMYLAACTLAGTRPSLAEIEGAAAAE